MMKKHLLKFALRLMPDKMVQSINTTIVLNLVDAYQKTHPQYWIEQCVIYNYPEELANVHPADMSAYWTDEYENMLAFRDLLLDSKPRLFKGHGRGNNSRKGHQESHKILWECRDDYKTYKKIMDDRKAKTTNNYKQRIADVKKPNE